MRLPSTTPLRGLLRCFDAAFFISSFEEEGLATLDDMRQQGQEGMAEFLEALSMPRGADARLLSLAFPSDDEKAEESETGNPAAPEELGVARCPQALDPTWLATVAPLYARHMGCENMGPLLYSLLRFVKPKHCLEIGAGYTSAFLLQALADNAREAEAWERWCSAEVGRKAEREAPWLVHEALPTMGTGVLHCVDNLAHSGTTAHHTWAVAKALGIEQHLRLHLDDARAFLSESQAELPAFDFIWLDGLLDFAPPAGGGGGGVKRGIDAFLAELWPRVVPGGYVLLHSTLTNSAVREWLAEVQAARWGPPGAVVSLLEPHKRFQNSVTLLQSRPEGFSEPIYSRLP